MPKASVREDYARLKALVPIAEHIIEAAGAAERILNLAASGDNLAARKDQLAKEVATVLAELEEAKKLRDQAIAESDAARKQYNKEQTAYAARLNEASANHANGLSAMEEESAAKMAAAEAAHAQKIDLAKKTHAGIVDEIAGLVARRKSLKEDLDQLVAKFR